MSSARRFFNSVGIIIAALFVFAVISYLHVPAMLFGGLGRIANPGFSALTRTIEPIKEVLSGPLTIRSAQKHVGELTEQVRLLTETQAQQSELERENSELRRELSFFEKLRYPLIVSRIIVHTREGGVDFFAINRGGVDGIVGGEPVTVGGTIIGKVIKVQSHVSIVAPLWLTSFKTAATFAGSETTSGIVEGELNAGLAMTLIPKDVSVKEGAVVITSGLEEKIPRGLVIGTVDRIQSQENDLFQTALLRTPITLQEATIVSVISYVGR